MTWLAWRQHRTDALVTAGVLGLLAVLLMAKALSEAATYQRVILPCFSASHQLYNLHGCQGVTTDFANNYGLVGVFAYLNFLPALLGMFVGAPLVAREIERGTHRFAWTQGITRVRWFGVKLGWLTLGALIATAGLILFVTWWRQPVDLIQGHLTPDAFDFEGPVLGAYVLFALGIGTLAGVLIRRTIPAMAVTLAAFLAVRLPVEALRSHLLPTVTHSAGVLTDYQTPTGAWVLDSGYQDAAGHHLSQVQVNALFDQAQAATTNKQGVFSIWLRMTSRLLGLPAKRSVLATAADRNHVLSRARGRRFRSGAPSVAPDHCIAFSTVRLARPLNKPATGTPILRSATDRGRRRTRPRPSS